MIWSIVSKEEMEGFKTTPVFGVYEEAIGRENIKLAVVNENDPLDFLQSGDIALLRTANQNIISNIRKKNVKTTAEDYDVYDTLSDKLLVSIKLKEHEINVPKEYSVTEIKEGKIYFVKPRFGSDSMGITSENVCNSADEVYKSFDKILTSMKQSPLIEDFLDGEEFTVACVRHHNRMTAAAIKVECGTKEGIQTFNSKLNINEYCSRVNGILNIQLEETAKRVCNIFHIQHVARVDFRTDKNGNLYVIDVNALPGLGMKAHLAKCFLLQRNYSYRDTMNLVITSAT